MTPTLFQSLSRLYSKLSPAQEAGLLGVGAGGLTYAFGPEIVSRLSQTFGTPTAPEDVTSSQRNIIGGAAGLLTALGAYMGRRGMRMDNGMVAPAGTTKEQIMGTQLSPEAQHRAAMASGYTPVELEKENSLNGYLDIESMEFKEADIGDIIAGAGEAAGNLAQIITNKGVAVMLGAPVVLASLAAVAYSRATSPSDAGLKYETEKIMSEDLDRSVAAMKRMQAYARNRKQIEQEQQQNPGRAMMLR